MSYVVIEQKSKLICRIKNFNTKIHKIAFALKQSLKIAVKSIKKNPT